MFFSSHSTHLIRSPLTLQKKNEQNDDNLHLWMIKRQALSTRPKVQTSNSICREGVHPLQAVMKYLLTLTVGPRKHNQVLKWKIVKLRVPPQLLVKSELIGSVFGWP